jgi:DNA-directed RNA polymerase I subunit RPA1
MLSLAESLLPKVLIRSVNGIDKCTLINGDQKDKKEPYLIVQGINFKAFYEHADTVDINRLQTNDIRQMQKQYGVEAGRANLVNEVRSVFKMYGIEVNYRHLSLIGDFMTFNGDYRAFNRIGMEESSSPLPQDEFRDDNEILGVKRPHEGHRQAKHPLLSFGPRTGSQSRQWGVRHSAR